MAAAECMCSLDNLGIHELHSLLSGVDARSLAALSCCSQALRAAASDEDLWKRLLRADWAAEAISARKAYAALACEFGMRDGRETYVRLSECVTYLRSVRGAMAATLRPGLDEGEADRALAALEQPPRSGSVLRTLWRLVGGQSVCRSRPEPASALAAYLCYDQLTTLALLSPVEAVELLRELRRVQGFPAGSWVPFAASLPGPPARPRVLLVHLESARVLVWPGWHVASPPGRPDGLVAWLELFCARLRSGELAVQPLSPEHPEIRCISLFPAAGPALASAVTRGVHITASPLFAPELSDARNGNVYCYRISMRLQSMEEQAGGGVRAVQLRTRHWIVADGSGEETEIRGEGVIGYMPTLRAGEEAFFYSSRTAVTRGPRGAPLAGTMRGSLRFAELEGPLAGGEFDAEVPLFHLRLPQDGFLF